VGLRILPHDIRNSGWSDLCFSISSLQFLWNGGTFAVPENRVRNLTLPVLPGYTKRPFTKSREKSILTAKSFWRKMKNNSDRSFAIIRFNERTYQSGGVMAVVKGTESGQRTLNDFEWCQSQEDRSAGWRYFLEETDLQPGTDPEKATKLRQLRLDLQESQA
jgi:hypothetical protein